MLEDRLTVFHAHISYILSFLVDHNLAGMGGGASLCVDVPTPFATRCTPQRRASNEFESDSG